MFNVGDRVRRLNFDNHVVVGDVYTVIRTFMDGADSSIYVEGWNGFLLKEFNFELVSRADVIETPIVVEDERQAIVLWTVVYRAIRTDRIQSNGFATKEEAERNYRDLMNYPGSYERLALKKITVRI